MKDVPVNGGNGLTTLLQDFRNLSAEELERAYSALPAYEEGRQNTARKAFFDRVVALASSQRSRLGETLEAILSMDGADRFGCAVRLLGLCTSEREAQKLYSELIERMEQERHSDEAHALLDAN